MNNYQIIQINPCNASMVYELFEKYRIFYGKESNLKSCIIFINERLRLGDSIIFIVTYQGRAIGFTQLYPKFSSAQMTKNWIINDL